MKKWNIRMTIIFAVVLVWAFAGNVRAEETLGFVSVQMTYQGEGISGGTLSLLDVSEWIHTEQGTLDADTLLDYARTQGVKGETKEIDEKGRVDFADLSKGTYLLYQEVAPQGFSVISPFMVNIPTQIGNEIYYDVDASPKVELKKEPQPEVSDKPTIQKGDKLPQTGQLNWPIPLLTISGLLLFAVGWYLCFVDKGEYHET